MNEDQQELLEIYKLHAELADRVSQRREGVNRLYASLLTGVLVVIVAFLRYGIGEIPVWFLSAGILLFGILLPISWYLVIRSYRQLNTGKFKALHEMEEKLAYPFFKREWELLKEGTDFRSYWKLTVVETILPLGFGMSFVVIAATLLLFEK